MNTVMGLNKGVKSGYALCLGTTLTLASWVLSIEPDVDPRARLVGMET